MDNKINQAGVANYSEMRRSQCKGTACMYRLPLRTETPPCNNRLLLFSQFHNSSDEYVHGIKKKHTQRANSIKVVIAHLRGHVNILKFHTTHQFKLVRIYQHIYVLIEYMLV